MAVKVAINGFGRIGRLALRLMVQNPEFDVVAINDLTDAHMLAHLFKYDSAQGRFDGTIEVKEDAFLVNGKEIKVFAQADPANLPWGQLGVDVVLECTGFFTKKEKAEAHIQAGAKKVVISAPATGDLKTIVYNVNDNILDGTETVISGASCTTNCLAPMAKALNDNFGIVEGLMTTIHAYTNDQNTLDGPHKKGDLRRARAAAANIVPNTTGAAKAIGLVIPELKGKLDGAAQRVPVITGSITELVTILEKPVTVEEVNAAMKAAATESFGYTEEQLVSSDIVGINFGSLFDATQTRVMTVGDKQLVKTVAWYDNEMSYTSQLIRTLKKFVELSK
ncbi:type I glyceraldehyde-3-phosphate dehydrogenase [Fusobacterium sp.]|uniref:type I glyceraldehyde-3-phosphate dehydrogenase n=1 Tax=Fusobacterium sp. TaxID=68766 RepID=UPI002606C530|nr:type I glyceraldehyde-3-phosphate dehydrogenase [Fusobacterium sp.]